MADWCVTSSSNVHEGTPAVGAQSEVRGHTVPALVAVVVPEGRRVTGAEPDGLVTCTHCKCERRRTMPRRQRPPASKRHGCAWTDEGRHRVRVHHRMHSGCSAVSWEERAERQRRKVDEGAR